MAQWYVKDLSKLTQISVQTLHYYDRIDLLKPSIRLPNGYRLYAEKDLLKLQQIIALKYFGFDLKQIKALLANKMDVCNHFTMQSQLLEEKANTLLKASKVLKEIIQSCKSDKSVPWETTIQSMEIYRMTQLLEKKWIGEILNAEELSDYVIFEKDLQTRLSDEEKRISDKNWESLTQDIYANLDKDPTSEEGVKIGRRCMEWVNHLYGKKHAAIRMTIWEKGFMSGYGSEFHGLSATATAWLDKAIYAYHTLRIKEVLSLINEKPSDEVLPIWTDLLIDIYGDNQPLKDNLIKEIMSNDRVNQTVKDWIKLHLKN